MGDLGATFAGIVTDGSLLVAIAVAALVRLISFASPCVLPLVPGYLGYVAGLTGATAAGPSGPPSSTTPSANRGAPGTVDTALAPTRSDRRRVLAGALLFVAGFSVVFVSFGALFGGLGRLLLEWAPLLTRVMGVVTIVRGLACLGAVPWRQRERRIHRRPPAGLAGAPVLGIVFGLGWTPCLGPTLSAVNTLAYSQASAARGAVLGLLPWPGHPIPSGRPRRPTGPELLDLCPPPRTHGHASRRRPAHRVGAAARDWLVGRGDDVAAVLAGHHRPGFLGHLTGSRAGSPNRPGAREPHRPALGSTPLLPLEASVIRPGTAGSAAPPGRPGHRDPVLLLRAILHHGRR